MISPQTRAATLLATLSIQSAHAASPASPSQTTTPPVLLPRANTQTLAWYSASQTSDQPSYAPWIFDAASTTYTTSGRYFRRCGVSSSCAMYTGCSDGYMVGSSTSSFCGEVGEAGATAQCSSHVLVPSVGATMGAGVLSWFWCDDVGVRGLTMFAVEPLVGSTGIPSTTSSLQSSDTASASPTPPSPNPADGNNTGIPSGVVAGCVIGGLAILASVLMSILCILRRDKRNKETPIAYQSKQQAAHQPPACETVAPHPLPPQELSAGIERGRWELPAQRD